MVKGGSARARARACKGRRGRRNLTKMQHRLLGCIHDPHSIRRRDASSGRESEARNSSAERFLPRFLPSRAAEYLLDARRRLVLSTLVFCRIRRRCCASYRVAMMTRWMSANQVLGQGCLEPITIAARWHATMRAIHHGFASRVIFLPFDDVSLFLSLPLVFFRLALSFTRTPTRALSQAPTSKLTLLGGLDALAPSTKIAGGPWVPLSGTVLPPAFPRGVRNKTSAFLGSLDLPRGRRHSAVSIFEYPGIATAMTSLRNTGETRMSPRDWVRPADPRYVSDEKLRNNIDRVLAPAAH